MGIRRAMNYRVAVKIIAFGVGAASLSLAALILWYGLAAEGLPGIAQEEGLMTATLSVLPWLLIIVAGLIGTNPLWALSEVTVGSRSIYRRAADQCFEKNVG